MTNPDPTVIREDGRQSLTVEVLGDCIAIMDRWSDETGPTRPVWLTARTAEDLAAALLTAAQHAHHNATEDEQR